ncbi:COP23 domain-containing protein [Microcoleus sp. bin38.metabat.b11b12b14.051]|uniref:COP23 domain-containing protein n=1 Tax=Microcoleus sp. bin38.metabat.b11b12b14.051 TaxID=2742709 RepID=UPI0025D15EFA|nr:COP23 domain-containing protein [Microcoleus sp. bin38.metabat.b11b12b14.051]
MLLKAQSFLSLLTGLAISLGLVTTLSQSTAAQNRTSDNNTFFCGTSNGQPATLVRGARRNFPLIRWTDNSFPPPWNAQQRCEEISQRLQRFHDNQVLNYIAAKMWAGQPVLCITSVRNGPCRPDGLLVTLKPGTDLQRTFQRLRNNLEGGADRTPLELSGNEAITYMNGEAYLDISKLLPEEDEAPPRILK